jgi:putative transposase
LPPTSIQKCGCGSRRGRDWFALVTQRHIRRGSFVSAKDLVTKIETFVNTYNTKARPFVWTATSEAILQKIARLCKVICGTEH